MIRVWLQVDQVIFTSPRFPLQLFIQPITYAFPEAFSLVKNGRRLRLNTIFYLVQRLRMRGAVLTQFHISSCIVKESPMKKIIRNPILRTSQFQFSASPVSKINSFVPLITQWQVFTSSAGGRQLTFWLEWGISLLSVLELRNIQ